MAICAICEKRRAGFRIPIKTSPYIEKELDLCGICYKKYTKLRETYAVKAYIEVVTQARRIHKND